MASAKARGGCSERDWRAELLLPRNKRRLSQRWISRDGCGRLRAGLSGVARRARPSRPPDKAEVSREQPVACRICNSQPGKRRSPGRLAGVGRGGLQVPWTIDWRGVSRHLCNRGSDPSHSLSAGYGKGSPVCCSMGEVPAIQATVPPGITTWL